MGKKLTPRETFDAALQQRTKIPIWRNRHPYKLIEAGRSLRQIRDTAIAALAYQRCPSKHATYLGCCLSYERHSWVRRMLAEEIPFGLGYKAVPGLEAMDRPDLLAPFQGVVERHILPAVTGALALPKGEPMMEDLVRVASRALLLVDETLTDLGF